MLHHVNNHCVIIKIISSQVILIISFAIIEIILFVDVNKERDYSRSIFGILYHLPIILHNALLDSFSKHIRKRLIGRNFLLDTVQDARCIPFHESVKMFACGTRIVEITTKSKYSAIFLCYKAVVALKVKAIHSHFDNKLICYRIAIGVNQITNFHFEIAADLLNEEEISLIRSMRPGLIQLEIGIQSANEETIREIRRKMDLDKVEHIVAEVRENRNVHQHLDLIAGLPYENYDSFTKSFDRVYSMRPDQLQLGFLKVLKGSLMHEKTREYGLVYQNRPPYEVLSTSWLSYADIVRLKKVEEMVEVYYNSGQFRNTVGHMEKEFTGAFAMYSTLADYYDRNGLFRVSHSRISRYEILFRFLEEHTGRPDEYVQWLTLDLYLRDNVRNRPQFLPENKVSSDEAAAFYKSEEEERRYLKSYTGYDRRQMRKMTHLERLSGSLFLFDYWERDPLSGDAKLYIIEDQERKIDNEFS